MTKQPDQRRARRLRADGASITRIARTLGVSKASVSLWVGDVDLTPAHRRALLESSRAARLREAARSSANS